MAYAAQHEASERDMDHGFGDIEAGLVVAHEPAPSDHPAQGSLDDPAAGQDGEAGLAGEATDDLDDEAEEGCLVHELAAIVGAIGEEVLQPWPALADRIEDHLSARAVGNIGGGQVDHQQPAIGIDGDMALAADNLLAGVIAALAGRRGLHRLTIQDAGRRARLPPRALAVEHQRHIVDRPEQELPHSAETTNRPSPKAGSLSAASASRSRSSPGSESRS